MNWWTSEPVLYSKPDLEGHRIRFLIAEKGARIATRIDGVDDFPDSLNDIDPGKHFPIITDKNLVCFGSALDELLHERYPSPTLLPIDPIQRAQVRMLAEQVRGWYDASPQYQLESLRDAEDAYCSSGTHFMAGNFISIVDIALMPLLYDAIELKNFVPNLRFYGYVKRMTSRPSFAQSLRSSNPTAAEDMMNEEAA